MSYPQDVVGSFVVADGSFVFYDLLSHYVRRRRDSKRPILRSEQLPEGILSVLRLDYLSCVLTIASTILVGRRYWGGWALAGANCVLMCIIGFRTAQLGFIPANVFCIVVSAINLRAWRRSRES